VADARANPYHNAWTESFIDEADARTELFSYIESCYNTHRRHPSLQYQTPAQFEAQFQSLN